MYTGTVRCPKCGKRVELWRSKVDYGRRVYRELAEGGLRLHEGRDCRTRVMKPVVVPMLPTHLSIPLLPPARTQREKLRWQGAAGERLRWEDVYGPERAEEMKAKRRYMKSRGVKKPKLTEMEKRRRRLIARLARLYPDLYGPQVKRS